MPETTPLIKAALNLRVGAGFDVYFYTATAVNEINVERPLRHIYELGAWLVT